MKKFLVTQKFTASADAVVAAYRRQETWESFADLPFVGDPTVDSFVDDHQVEVAMAYKVTLQLPPLAENFIDADKMTFIERTTLAEDGSGRFVIEPDHYAKLLKSSGRIEMVPLDDGHCERMIQGSVDLSLGWAGKLFEGPVEDAIVNGLKEALAAQAAQIDSLLD